MGRGELRSKLKKLCLQISLVTSFRLLRDLDMARKELGFYFKLIREKMFNNLFTMGEIIL